MGELGLPVPRNVWVMWVKIGFLSEFAMITNPWTYNLTRTMMFSIKCVIMITLAVSGVTKSPPGGVARLLISHPNRIFDLVHDLLACV